MACARLHQVIEPLARGAFAHPQYGIGTDGDIAIPDQDTLTAIVRGKAPDDTHRILGFPVGFSKDIAVVQDKFVQIEDRSRVGVITVHSGFSSIDIEADFLDGCLHAISNGETAPSAFTADGQYAGGQGALFGAIALNADTRTGAYITKHIVRAFSIDDIESSAGFAVTRKIDSTIDRQSALVFPGLYGIVSIGKSFYMVSGDVAVGRDIAPP